MLWSSLSTNTGKVPTLNMHTDKATAAEAVSPRRSTKTRYAAGKDRSGQWFLTCALQKPPTDAKKRNGRRRTKERDTQPHRQRSSQGEGGDPTSPLSVFRRDPWKPPPREKKRERHLCSTVRLTIENCATLHRTHIAERKRGVLRRVIRDRLFAVCPIFCLLSFSSSCFAIENIQWTAEKSKAARYLQAYKTSSVWFLGFLRFNVLKRDRL